MDQITAECLRSAEFQRLLDFPHQAASHREALSVLQDDDVFPFEHGLEFLHAVEVHDGASADAEKFLGVELRFERVQRLTQDAALLAGVNRDVVSSRFDGFNVRGLDNHDLVVTLDGKAREIIGVAEYRRRALPLGEEVEQPARCRTRLLVGKVFVRPGNGGLESRGLEGFEKVVERVGLKCADPGRLKHAAPQASSRLSVLRPI
jgi:hypothetical protein